MVLIFPQNAAINYRNGWFFVTSKVAHDRSIFGAIVGERCDLNALGRVAVLQGRD